MNINNYQNVLVNKKDYDKVKDFMNEEQVDFNDTLSPWYINALTEVQYHIDSCDDMYEEDYYKVMKLFTEEDIESIAEQVAYSDDLLSQEYNVSVTDNIAEYVSAFVTKQSEVISNV